MARSLCWGVHVQPYQLKLMEVSGTCIYVLISMETRKNKKIDCAMQNYHTSNILEKCATKVITTKHLSFWNKIVSYIATSNLTCNKWPTCLFSHILIVVLSLSIACKVTIWWT
jgi:hypothetical protein